MSDIPWVTEVSSFINKRKGICNMELYHLISSFPQLTFIIVGIDIVCWVVKVGYVIV